MKLYSINLSVQTEPSNYGFATKTRLTHSYIVKKDALDCIAILKKNKRAEGWKISNSTRESFTATFYHKTFNSVLTYEIENRG